MSQKNKNKSIVFLILIHVPCYLLLYFIITKKCTISITKVFIHLVVCLTTGPKPLPKRVVHIVRSRASSFKSAYPVLSLRSSSSFLRLLPRLPVTSLTPFIFPSITCCRRQFLRKMWPIQLAFRLLISYIYIYFIYIYIYIPYFSIDNARVIYTKKV